MLPFASLADQLKQYVPRQRWYGAKDHPIEKVVPHKIEVMRPAWPALVRVEADIEASGEAERYQLLIGLRPAGEASSFVENNPEAVIGLFETDEGPAYGYDGLKDPELSLELLRMVYPEAEPPARVEPIKGEQSNSSLVYDSKLILKIFRRLSNEPNLDVEVTQALGGAGFRHVPAPLTVWREDGIELGIVQPYLPGVDGWAFTLTSLRDYYGQGGDPSQAGGDFAAEARMLGRTLADLHSALAEVFGRWPGDPERWAEAMRGQLARISHPLLDSAGALKVFDELAATKDPGPSIRVHGDLHLGQLLRTDSGWYVLDFEGEPNRPKEERRQPTSPLKDVAGVLRSFHYAAWSAREESEEKVREPAKAWEKRNREAFLTGYREVAHKEGGILPPTDAAFNVVLKAFELDRAIYEVGYEMANRPTWIEVPLAAVTELY